MRVRFWIDPETGLPHIFNHDATEDEVRQVLSRRGSDYPEGRKARTRLGQTAVGRHLKVVYVPTRVARLPLLQLTNCAGKP